MYFFSRKKKKPIYTRKGYQNGLKISEQKTIFQFRRRHCVSSQLPAHWHKFLWKSYQYYGTSEGSSYLLGGSVLIAWAALRQSIAAIPVYFFEKAILALTESSAVFDRNTSPLAKQSGQGDPPPSRVEELHKFDGFMTMMFALWEEKRREPSMLIPIP